MKENEIDQRVKTKHHTYIEFLLTFFVLSVLTAGQMMIYSKYVDMKAVPVSYIMAMQGYWAVVSAIFALVTHWQRKKNYDKPMRRLSQAAKQVAEGDFSIYVAPIHTPDKKDYIDVMFDDFNTMVQELGSIETLKNDFISNVSHEIKTPLAIIENYAMMMQDESLSKEERKEYSETIMTATKKLSTLVTNILKLNKLDNQGIKSNPSTYDLSRQLAECALSFEDLWERKNLLFEANIEDRCLIHADESLLEIVWNNLLSNAIKFTDPGGTVSLTQTSDEELVTITVSDTGCGMDANTKKHIFDKFFQGDTSHLSEGNGLGLALTLKVIDLLDGTITVRSQPKEGTTFTVQLRK